MFIVLFSLLSTQTWADQTTMEPPTAVPTHATMELTLLGSEASPFPSSSPSSANVSEPCLLTCWECHQNRDPCLWEFDTAQEQRFDTFECDLACSDKEEYDYLKAMWYTTIGSVIGCVIGFCLRVCTLVLWKVCCGTAEDDIEKAELSADDTDVETIEFEWIEDEIEGAKLAVSLETLEEQFAELAGQLWHEKRSPTGKQAGQDWKPVVAPNIWE